MPVYVRGSPLFVSHQPIVSRNRSRWVPRCKVFRRPRTTGLVSTRPGDGGGEAVAGTPGPCETRGERQHNGFWRSSANRVLCQSAVPLLAHLLCRTSAQAQTLVVLPGLFDHHTGEGVTATPRPRFYWMPSVVIR